MVGGLSWTNIKTVSTNERQANFTLTNHRPGNCFHSFQIQGTSEWGSLKHASNFAHFALQAAKINIFPEQSIRFAMKQINYVLGDTGSEFVMGFFGAILKRFLDKLGNFVGNNIKI